MKDWEPYFHNKQNFYNVLQLFANCILDCQISSQTHSQKSTYIISYRDFHDNHYCHTQLLNFDFTFIPIHIRVEADKQKQNSIHYDTELYDLIDSANQFGKLTIWTIDFIKRSWALQDILLGRHDWLRLGWCQREPIHFRFVWHPLV